MLLHLHRGQSRQFPQHRRHTSACAEPIAGGLGTAYQAPGWIAGGRMARRTREVHNLTSLLDALESKTTGDGAATVTVRDILQLIGRRAYGPLLLIVGLIAISPATIIPGATWAFATLTLIIAIQLLFIWNRNKNCNKILFRYFFFYAFVSLNIHFTNNSLTIF